MTGWPIDDAVAAVGTIGSGPNEAERRAALVADRTPAEHDRIIEAIGYDGQGHWLLHRLAELDHASAKQASKTGEPIPATPYLNELTRRNSDMTSTKAPTKPLTANGSNGTRGRTSERGQQARAESKRLSNKRGPGRKLTDAELAAYVEKVRGEFPDARSIDEQQYAYWVEGIAVSNGTRWDRAWDAATGAAPEPEAQVADLAVKREVKAKKATTQKKAVAAAKKAGAATKPLSKPPVPRKAKQPSLVP